MKPYRFVSSLAADRRGVSSIELAAVLPMLLLLLLGMVDISRLVAARLDLEQAAQRTTDLALAKRPQSADGTYLRNEAVTAAGVAAASVTVQIYLECDGTRQSSFNTVCPTGQKRARYVSVAIQNSVQPIFNWAQIGAFLGFTALSSAVTVTGDSIVRFQ